MGHSRVRAKVRQRKVAALAAYSRQFTVRNVKKNISPVVKHVRYGTDIPKDMLITNPLTGNQFVMVNPHTITGNYGVTVTGHDWIPVEEYKSKNGLLWKNEKHPQPKNLRKKKSFWYTTKDGVKHYVSHKSEYPDYTPQERKNPAPADMFTEDVEKWKQLRETAKERFRDFVVSIYDPLYLTGRFVIAKEGSATYTEEKVAEIKDVDGEGHRVNELPKDSKLMKKAQKITNETKAKRKNLVATNLKDHKRQKGRIILPEAA